MSSILALGLDVSKHDPIVDVGRLHGLGFTFCAVRATVGDYYTDPTFAQHWQMLQDGLILRTAYHVIRWPATPQGQITRFRQAVGDGPFDLPLVLDAEYQTPPPNMPNVRKVIESVKACAEIVTNWTGKKPIIYTNVDWWNTWMCLNGVSPEWCWEYPLWLAQYGGFPCRLPNGWVEWAFWQTTDRQPVWGIGSKAVDICRFNGDETVLRQWALGR